MLSTKSRRGPCASCSGRSCAGGSTGRVTRVRAAAHRHTGHITGVVGALAYRGAMGSTDVEVRRSRKRRRTVSAYREDGRTIVLIPARFTKAEEQQWVATMLDRLAKGDRRRRPSDNQLRTRAGELSQRYLGGQAR